jgi:spermidine synthase
MPTSQKKLVLLLFFSSGFSGLVYEVVWMRLLSLVFGNSVYATATVLAGFMGGLAIGSFVFGGIADRTANPLRLYGVLELLVGCFALVFPFLLKALLPVYLWYARVSGAGYQSLSFAQAILLVLLLFIPTTLMGGTLPLLTRHLARQMSALGQSLGLLYGLNTLGAVLGCAGAGFVMIATLGVRATTWVAIAITFLVGLVALYLSRASVASEPAAGPVARAVAPPPGAYPSWLLTLLLLLLGVAGLTGMAYEVLWTRVLTFLTGTTIYAFTIMLTAYLCGLALGGLIAAAIADRTKRLVEAFGLLQILVALSVLATLAGTPSILKSLNGFLFQGSAQRLSEFASFLVLQGTASSLFIFPGAVLMGMTFPVAAKVYTASRGRTGSGVGMSYFADTIGAIAGSLAAGFFLIPRLGTLNSLLLVAGANLAIGVVAFSCTGSSGPETRFSRTRFSALALGAVLVALVARGSIPPATFSGVFVPPNARLAYINEDVGGTVTIEDYGDHRTISINGVNVAGTDLKFETTQKLQAHLALLLHPHPRKVLQIGFGSGGTAWAITRHPVEEINCVEITKAIIKARNEFRENNHGVLEDPRVRVCIDDARSFLVKTDEKYDAILSDSIHPRLAGNGGLYCTDYFRLCRQHLNPDGIFSAWLPYYGMSLEDFRVAVRSLKAVFPHVYLFHSPMGRTEWTIILGMFSPLNIDVEALRRKMAAPTVAEDLRRIKVERVEDILSCILLGDMKLKEFVGTGQTLNTDDFPYLEYVAPRSAIASVRETLVVPIYAEFIRCREGIVPYLHDPIGSSRETILQAYASSSLVLEARLAEMTEPTNQVRIHQLLGEALQLDPRNNVARNLQDNP